jgi:hypothetical protein
VPDRIADALLDVAESNRKVATGLEGFTAEVHSIDRRRGRQLVALGVCVFLLLGAAAANFTTLQIVRCALTPGCSTYERNSRNSAKLVGELVVESDCRSRRADAGLAPPPDPAKRCTQQTPMAVYPGPGVMP